MAILPNALTVARLVMVPIFILVYFIFPENSLYAFLVYALAMFTDALDGHLARAMNCTSKFGTLIDPLADKFMTLSAILCLTWSRYIPYAVLILVAVKEIVMITGAFLAARTGIIISAGLPGKLATALFTFAIGFTIPWHGVPALTAVGTFLMYPAVALSLYAAVYYAVILVKKAAPAKPH